MTALSTTPTPRHHVHPMHNNPLRAPDSSKGLALGMVVAVTENGDVALVIMVNDLDERHTNVGKV